MEQAVVQKRDAAENDPLKKEKIVKWKKYSDHNAIDLFNGGLIPDNDSSVKQFIDPSKYMVVPDVIYAKCDGKQWEITDAEEIVSEAMVLINAHRLSQDPDRSSIEHATLMAVMQLRACMEGLLVAFENRGVYQDEVVKTDFTQEEFKKILTDFEIVKLEDTIVLASTMLVFSICMSAIGFMQRGHHWLDSFEPMYNRMYEIVFPTHKEKYLTGNECMRIWIHPFGIKQVWLLYKKWCVHGYTWKGGQTVLHVPECLRIRADIMPIGCADIGIARKVIQYMRQEVFWTAFTNTFGAHIGKIWKTYDAIISDQPSNHMYATLYGSVKVDQGEAKESVSVLQPYLLAYIDYMGTDTSLSRQRALAKNRADSSQKQARFLALLKQYDRKIKDEGTIESFFYESEQAMKMQASTNKEELARILASIGSKQDDASISQIKQ